LAIPGKIVEIDARNAQQATVDVVGVRRKVDLGLLAEESIRPGDWVLIHVGFAMAKIDQAEAQRALEGLQLMGQAYAEEVQAVIESQIA